MDVPLFNSILLIEKRASKGTVVAVPHHAPLGMPRLPCDEHPKADENAGCVGHALATLLNCHSIIACNYHIDSNKHEDSDYWKQLIKWTRIGVRPRKKRFGVKAKLYTLQILLAEFGGKGDR